ncbi:MAG TPA: hypothetical protein PLK42_15325, partial [Casimicrobium sp.]|nr:hypothetical protein [Casimicrobium sp.]
VRGDPEPVEGSNHELVGNVGRNLIAPQIDTRQRVLHRHQRVHANQSGVARRQVTFFCFAKRK